MIIRTLAAVLLAFPLSLPLLSGIATAAACKKTDPGLAGVYQLRGVRETGSLIRLLPNGRFDYMLSYGAYDEVARGCWQRHGGIVRLVPTKMRHGPGGPTFKQLKMTISGVGNLVRRLGPKQIGRYVRVRR